MKSFLIIWCLSIGVQMAYGNPVIFDQNSCYKAAEKVSNIFPHPAQMAGHGDPSDMLCVVTYEEFSEYYCRCGEKITLTLDKWDGHLIKKINEPVGLCENPTHEGC